MIELISKYSKDLGMKIPESLLLIDKYEKLFELTDRLKKLKTNDSSTKYIYKQ